MKINSNPPPPPGAKKPPPPPGPPIPPHVAWEENHPCYCCHRLKIIAAKVDDVEEMAKVIMVKHHECLHLSSRKSMSELVAHAVSEWIKRG